LCVNPAPGKQGELINPTTMFLMLRQWVPQMSSLPPIEYLDVTVLKH